MSQMNVVSFCWVDKRLAPVYNCMCALMGVFGVETDEMSAMEGDSFTLRTGLTEVQRDDEIEWRFGSSRTRLTRIAAGNITTYNDEKFRDRLQLERQTGDLPLTNITNEHNGVYQLSIIIRSKKSTKRFAVTVYAPVSIPVIFSDTSQSSSSAERSSRIFLCSVVNVSHVTLSWYKGNSLLSSISVSDLSISLSLPLEVEYQEKNTYSCGEQSCQHPDQTSGHRSTLSNTFRLRPLF
ncbi:uncharacterized protein LOC107709688 [Sinocyclocheilus rhinocerous]|uniref:uncharacterized protein LOC107709688 n=1 Tax=Sinocyclocheilus rhinocerous TaxID=307959 RepID=UPI0007B9636F|nr:PREDICTED: uncharacterized protein LOC107709688 [Sinocyclocheilus rhinocerous]